MSVSTALQTHLDLAVRIDEALRTPGQLQTSPFRSWAFDLAVFVLLRDYDYVVRRAVLVSVDLVRAQSSYRSHVNGSVVMMRGALLDHEDAEDITDRLRAAASDG